MPIHDIIVVGASAGGVEALRTLVHGLPSDLPASICVVLHIAPQGANSLPQILERAGPLQAVAAANGEPLKPGRIYVAVPDHHLLIERGHVRLAQGPKENGSRPAVDPLFRSAAQAYGPRVVGVLLTGNLDDGTAGLLSIKNGGGITVVQDPDEARFSGMPSSAIENTPVDEILPLAGIAPRLAQLAQEKVTRQERPNGHER